MLSRDDNLPSRRVTSGRGNSFIPFAFPRPFALLPSRIRAGGSPVAVRSSPGPLSYCGRYAFRLMRSAPSTP